MMLNKEVKLTDIIAPSFYEVHKAIKKKEFTEFWLKGGRGSCKSTFAAMEIILGIVGDKNANALVVRKTATTLRSSVMQTLLFAIDLLKLDNYFDHTKSPAEIIYLPTDQRIVMRGLDEPSKLKSIKVRKGYFKFLWFEEGEEYSSNEEIRSVRQSALRGGKEFFEFFTYNPPRNPHHWLYNAAKEHNEERMVHHSNYLDVPREWLGDKFFGDAERLKRNNFEAYQHEYGGLPLSNPDEIIFSGCYEVMEFETPKIEDIYQNRFFYGADWGFANDPTALIRCFIMDDFLCIDKEVFGWKVQIDKLPELFDQIPESRKWQILADNSRPETISYLFNRGFNIKGASKTADKSEGETKNSFIIEGIEYIKSFKKVIIHPSCVNLIKEFQNYAYKVDKNTKEILPLVDGDKGFDHGIDALRYALSNYIRKKVSILDAL